MDFRVDSRIYASVKNTLCLCPPAWKLHAAGEAVKYTSLREQIRSARFVWVELCLER